MAENDWLQLEGAALPGGATWWIGLYERPSGSGTYVWEDLIPTTWDLWDTGEPSFVAGGVCAAQKPINGRWEGINCNLRGHPFVCEGTPL